MPTIDPKPESNALSTFAYYDNTTWPQTNWPQTWTYPYTYSVPQHDEARFRFALELIAGGGLTHEAIAKIVRVALRRDEE